MSGYYVDTRYHPLPIYILHFGSFSLHTARSHDQARAGASCAKFLTNFHKFQSRPSEELKMLGLAQACCSCRLVTDWRSCIKNSKIMSTIQSRQGEQTRINCKHFVESKIKLLADDVIVVDFLLQIIRFYIF